MIDTQWSILYRGPLSSCNYSCSYCPFAKRRNSGAELLDDARKLRRFCSWVANRSEKTGVLFTPWGEALIHRHYRQALIDLSHTANVWRVAIQTNLSCPLDWLSQCNTDTVALWTTFHPSQVSLEKFLAAAATVDSARIRFSVGVVGTKDSFASLRELRRKLPSHVYVWVNAYKRHPDYYSPADIEFLRSIDPFFDWNLKPHPTLGQPCRTGHTVFTVDGDGDIRRCHFISEVLGNIYEAGFESRLRQRPCSNDVCRCHIGYVHLETLDLYSIFGQGVLERIPSRFQPPTPAGRTFSL